MICRQKSMVPVVSPDFTVRENLEKVLNSVILADSLNEIVYDAKEMEYREYGLSIKTDNQGTDYGGIEDAMIVFNTWKNDGNDRVLRIFLEYEVFNYGETLMQSTGISRQVGLILKIVK